MPACWKYPRMDISTARFSNVALEGWWKKKDISSLWFEAIGWASRVGTGFIKQYWDADKGEKGW